jgi:hypothetical protein
MAWRGGWPDPVPRPKVRKLSADEQKRTLTVMAREIERSPVLSGFGLQPRFLRQRFYIERHTPEGVRVWGRITPVAGDLLLEVEGRSWREVDRGNAKKLILRMANDTRGTFHGLGALDRSLRSAGQGLARQPMTVGDGKTFRYAGSEEEPSVQEVLFHFFGLPMEVVAQPAYWYAYHRTPWIREFSADKSRVLVSFTASSMWGSFGGACLYALRDGQWGAYTIRPSESGSIAAAETWLVKRKWEAWNR